LTHRIWHGALQAAETQKHGEVEIEIPPPLSLGDLPPALAHTLQHIVSKMDMMTQVIGMVEERLSLNEDKMAQLDSKLQQLLPGTASPPVHHVENAS
jgi:hypothetical protein